MKLIPISLIASAAFLTSCQNMDNGEAKARHEEMKQLLTSYDSKVTTKQDMLEKKVKEQEKLIAELTKLVASTQKELKEWNSAKNKDAVKAALSLKDTPNYTVRRSVMTILGQLKGPAAEQGIVDMTINETYASNVSTGLDILKNIGSGKVRETCLKVLEKNNPATMQYAFRHIADVATEKDVSKIVEIAKNLSPSSTDYNTRYCWQYIMKLFLAKGDKDCLPIVMKVIKESNKETFKNVCWGLVVVSKLGTEKDFKTAAKVFKPYINNKNVYMDSDVSYWFRENSNPKYVPAMKLLIQKARGSYRRYYFEGFANMAHPALAKDLVDEFNTTKDSSTKSILTKAFQGGYPGTMWFEERQKAELIPEAELKELIKKFDAE